MAQDGPKVTYPSSPLNILKIAPRSKPRPPKVQRSRVQKGSACPRRVYSNHRPRVREVVRHGECMSNLDAKFNEQSTSNILSGVHGSIPASRNRQSSRDTMSHAMAREAGGSLSGESPLSRASNKSSSLAGAAVFGPRHRKGMKFKDTG